MGLFRFAMIGTSQQPVMEVDGVHTAVELNEMIRRERFVVGRLVPEYCEGVNCGALLATSRIQMVTEVD